MPLTDTKSYWKRYANLGKNMTFRDGGFSPSISIWETCPQLAALDPAAAYTFYDDFYSFVLNNSDQTGWISTEVESGAGDAAITIDDAAGGVLKIVNDDADNDSVQLQWNSENFKFVANKPLWFESRFKLSDATQSDLLVGLCITDTTLIAGVTDGVFFRKDDGNREIDIVTKKDNTATEGIYKGTLTDDTYIRLGFIWDGVSTVSFFINGTWVGESSTNIVDDEELTVSFAHQNGEAVAKTAYIDYIKVVQIR